MPLDEPRIQLSIFLLVISVTAIVWALLLYPPLIRHLAASRPGPGPDRMEPDGPVSPAVTVIVPVVNEVEALGRCLAALRTQDPLPEQVVVVVDAPAVPDGLPGLTDSSDLAVELALTGGRHGKTRAHGLGAARSRGEILVFVDVSAELEPGAIRHLCKALADPDVGVACGRLVYIGAGVEAGYWDHECSLKEAESRFHSALGANGALYALRRADHLDLPDEAIGDLVEPLLIYLRTGRVTRFVAEARAREPVPADPRSLLRIKSRIHQRVLQSLAIVSPLLHPGRYPRMAFMVISHKLLRWFLWLWVLLATVGAAGLLGPALLAVIPLAAGATWAARALPGPAPRWLELPVYALVLLAAQLAGTARWLAGVPSRAWDPTFGNRGHSSPAP